MMRLPWKPILAFWSLLILGIALTPGSHITRLPEVSLLPHADKLIHFLLFAGFGFIHTVTLLQRKRRKITAYFCSSVLITGILFGGATEILQLVLPIERDGSLADLLANSLGVLGGLVLALAGSRKGWISSEN
jgi:VanZ family protein